MLFLTIEEAFESIKTIVNEKEGWFYLYLTQEHELELWYRKGGETDLEFNESSVTDAEFEKLAELVYENDLPVVLYKEFVL